MVSSGRWTRDGGVEHQTGREEAEASGCLSGPRRNDYALLIALRNANTVDAFKGALNLNTHLFRAFVEAIL